MVSATEIMEKMNSELERDISILRAVQNLTEMIRHTGFDGRPIDSLLRRIDEPGKIISKLEARETELKANISRMENLEAKLRKDKEPIQQAHDLEVKRMNAEKVRLSDEIKNLQNQTAAEERKLNVTKNSLAALRQQIAELHAAGV